jgi:hypothetical protein
VKPANPLLGLIKEAHPDLTDADVIARAIALQTENDISFSMLAGLARTTLMELVSGRRIADVAQKFSGYLMEDAATEVRSPEARTMADVVRMLPTFPGYVTAVLDEDPINKRAFEAILHGMIAMAEPVSEADRAHYAAE